MSLDSESATDSTRESETTARTPGAPGKTMRMIQEFSLGVPGALAVFLFTGGVALVDCGGAGPYGHAPRYVVLEPETSALAGAREYVAADARRSDKGRTAVSAFGVVEQRTAGPGGQALLKLGVRRLEPQNTCERPGDDDSCRVTVSGSDFGTLWALVSLRSDDDVGPAAVRARSLVRVVAAMGQEVSPVDGSPVVHASWYRHWPPAEYTQAALARP